MHRFGRSHPLLLLLLGVTVLGIALFLGFSVGPMGFRPLGGLFSSETRWFFHIRAPRVLLAAMLGSTLALSGAALQGLLRNPLVSPYTIGVSSGSSLGAVVAIRFGLEGLFGASLGLFPVAITAGLAAMLLLFGLSKKGASFTGTSLLLAGITLSFFCSAMIMFIQYTATYQESFKMVRWLMGSLDFITYRELLLLLPFVLPASLYLLSAGKQLNLMTLGEETARSAGLDLGRLTLGIFFFVSLAIAATVSVSGPLAFVGLIVPHILRLLGATNYRLLLPASALFGAAFLVAADTLARVILPQQAVPVGVITSLLGAPSFMVACESKEQITPVAGDRYNPDRSLLLFGFPLGGLVLVPCVEDLNAFGGLEHEPAVLNFGVELYAGKFDVVFIAVVIINDGAVHRAIFIKDKEH